MQERHKNQAKNQNGSTVRVLLVDDEWALGLTLARAMGEHYEVLIETSGEDALRRLERDTDFDAILCDLNMPDCSGVTLYEKMAEAWPGLEKRVVFMTGGIYDEHTSRFLSAIPNSCLEKPFDISTLERALPSPRVVTTAG